jgi:hypothetical protein
MRMFHVKPILPANLTWPATPAAGGGAERALADQAYCLAASRFKEAHNFPTLRAKLVEQGLELGVFWAAKE